MLPRTTLTGFADGRRQPIKIADVIGPMDLEIPPRNLRRQYYQEMSKALSVKACARVFLQIERRSKKSWDLQIAASSACR